MYGSLRWKQGFCDGVNAFIEATEKNAASKKKPKYFVRAATARTISSEVTDYNQIALDHAGICEGLHRIDPSW
jgi:hypothetical protein